MAKSKNFKWVKIKLLQIKMHSLYKLLQFIINTFFPVIVSNLCGYDDNESQKDDIVHMFSESPVYSKTINLHCHST